MIINEENKISLNKKFKKQTNQIFYESFNILSKYPNEFNEFILRCHNFLSIVLFSIDLYSMKDNQEIYIEKYNVIGNVDGEKYITIYNNIGELIPLHVVDLNNIHSCEVSKIRDY